MIDNADMNDDEFAAMLRKAMRERMLSEVSKPRDIERIVNNVYGGDVAGSQKRPDLGLMGTMQDERAINPDDRDYWVDITREDLPELNPLTGKPKGWKKTVKRYTKARGEGGEDPGAEKKK